MHKSGGSLTRAPCCFWAGGEPGLCPQVINLTQTTSASYLLLSSLDISRENLPCGEKEAFGEVVKMAEYARGEINASGAITLMPRSSSTGTIFLIST
jgi:arginine/lysine/ornithine decarboxylase